MEEALGGLLRPCIESRPACQALKSLATHKTDRNDARGLAHLARTGGSSVHVVRGAALVFTVAGAYAWEHGCSGAGVYDNHPCLRRRPESENRASSSSPLPPAATIVGPPDLV
jgi:hypothetical protein